MRRIASVSSQSERDVYAMRGASCNRGTGASHAVWTITGLTIYDAVHDD
jgi:hypothetical protein